MTVAVVLLIHTSVNEYNPSVSDGNKLTSVWCCGVGWSPSISGQFRLHTHGVNEPLDRPFLFVGAAASHSASNAYVCVAVCPLSSIRPDPWHEDDFNVETSW